MKRLRPILWSFAALAILLVVVVGLAFNASFQTWATRRVLTSQPDVKAGVGRVSAGLKVTELTDINIQKPGFALSLPSLKIEMPLASAAGKTIAVRRLVAKGWRVDLSTPASLAAEARKGSSANPAAKTAGAGKATSGAAEPFSFEGVLRLLKLPVDFSLDEIDVEGEVVLPAEPGQVPVRAAVRLVGGKLGAGSQGRFNYSAKVVLPDAAAPVSRLDVVSDIEVLMDTPRTFRKVGVATTAKAFGAKFPDGATLQLELVLNGTDKGESYQASVQTRVAEVLKNLFSLDASFPFGAASLSGKWKLDLSQTDVAPFLLGLSLPVFTATGDGAFEADRTFKSIHASGRVDSAVDQLSVLIPELAALGRIRTQLDFDLHKQDALVRVERFSASISGAKPIASVQALQKFDYDLTARAMKVADSSAELLRLTLHGLPLAWAQPFLKGYTVSGDDVRGEFFASARNGGFAVRPSGPLTVTNLNVAQAGKPLVRALDIAARIAADSTQQGWQADVSEISVRSGLATLISGSVKAGQPSGNAQPIKAAGRMEANLPALLAQPAAADYASLLTQGLVKAEFTASLDGTKQLSATMEASNLASGKVEKLPRLSASLRADLKADGKIEAQIPLLIDAAGRKSDLEVTARIQTTPELRIEADVVSTAIYVQDLQPLQALAATLPAQPQARPAKPANDGTKVEPSSSAKAAPQKPVADRVPFWNTCNGQLKLALKEIVYSPEVRISNVGGQVKIDAGAIIIENVKAGFGDASEALLNGRMNFEPKAAEPYEFSGTATLSGFDPAPYFRLANPQKAPTVEGKFDMTSKLTGSAPNAALLAGKIKADMTLTSRGGVFRGLALPKAFADRFQGKSGNLLSSITGAVGAIAGGAKVGNAAAAAVELTALLAAIPFDQLNIQLSHDAVAALTHIQDFTLISPTIRLNGSGSILQQEGVPLLKQPLTAQISLSSHGQVAELFNKQGMLQGGSDPLGYFPLFAPLKLDGTLSEIGTEALMNLLVQKIVSNSASPLGNLFGK